MLNGIQTPGVYKNKLYEHKIDSSRKIYYIDVGHLKPRELSKYVEKYVKQIQRTQQSVITATQKRVSINDIKDEDLKIELLMQKIGYDV